MTKHFKLLIVYGFNSPKSYISVQNDKESGETDFVMLIYNPDIFKLSGKVYHKNAKHQRSRLSRWRITNSETYI